MSVNYAIKTSQGYISIWDSQRQGQPVLFIHGNSACKEAFARQFEDRSFRKYRFMAIDLPGHGKSDKAKDPDTTYTIPGYADVAIEVIQQLRLENPVVVGWSLGGHVALSMLQKAQKLAGVLITGTPPINISDKGFQAGFRPLPVFQTLFRQVQFSREEVDQFMSGGGFDTKEAPFVVDAALKTDGYARKRLAESMMQGVGGDQKAIVERDSTPLCVVQGEKDQGINNEYVLSAVNYRNLFSKQVYIVKDSGHAVFWEKSEEFNTILSVFLSNI